MTTDRFVMPFGVTETSWATVFLFTQTDALLKVHLFYAVHAALEAQMREYGNMVTVK
jgi:hypothetical protein